MYRLLATHKIFLKLQPKCINYEECVFLFSVYKTKTTNKERIFSL